MTRTECDLCGRTIRSGCVGIDLYLSEKVGTKREYELCRKCSAALAAVIEAGAAGRRKPDPEELEEKQEKTADDLQRLELEQAKAAGDLVRLRMEQKAMAGALEREKQLLEQAKGAWVRTHETRETVQTGYPLKRSIIAGPGMPSSDYDPEPEDFDREDDGK